MLPISVLVVIMINLEGREKRYYEMVLHGD